jgi:hypothetical protein
MPMFSQPSDRPSGHPGDRPTTVAGLQALVDIATDEAASEMDRVSAANAILDLGYGEPPQEIIVIGDPVELAR